MGIWFPTNKAAKISANPHDDAEFLAAFVQETVIFTVFKAAAQGLPRVVDLTDPAPVFRPVRSTNSPFGS